jgi:hypothetical protein
MRTEAIFRANSTQTARGCSTPMRRNAFANCAAGGGSVALPDMPLIFSRADVSDWLDLLVEAAAREIEEGKRETPAEGRIPAGVSSSVNDEGSTRHEHEHCDTTAADTATSLRPTLSPL